MTKQKKPKTGDVVGWATVCKETGWITGTWLSRAAARRCCNSSERIAKIVITK